MSLQAEIDKARAEIRTDGYAVSIGEWISIYEKGELDIHPEFQRFFRWTSKQKSRLIESILLGIPIPQVFVAQRPDGIWDVVDGLQRLSTIYQLVGILRNEEGEVLAPLTLERTTYLPSLEGLHWQDDDHPDQSLTNVQRLLIKRAKIDVSIILKESDVHTKFELFQRLNTGGSSLSDQEMRNSLLVMINRDFFFWMKNLAQDEHFLECVSLSDRAEEEQYGMELVLRFLSLRRLPQAELTGIGDLGDFLTEKARELATDTTLNKTEEAESFQVTFAVLWDRLASSSFRRYDRVRNRFLGRFSISAFEVIALGIGYNYRRISGVPPDTIIEIVKRVWSEEDFIRYSGAGISASTRIPRTVPLGRRLFAI
jgi:hypothetical protein